MCTRHAAALVARVISPTPMHSSRSCAVAPQPCDNAAAVSLLRHVPGQEWHLDTAAREIGRGDRHIRLAEKPFRVLRALVDAGGEVVTRATLRDLLWSEDTFVDFDNNLNSTVAALRRELQAAPQGTNADDARSETHEISAVHVIELSSSPAGSECGTSISIV
jgi:DNA-binding response OmpR family regulator